MAERASTGASPGSSWEYSATIPSGNPEEHDGRQERDASAVSHQERGRRTRTAPLFIFPSEPGGGLLARLQETSGSPGEASDFTARGGIISSRCRDLASVESLANRAKSAPEDQLAALSGHDRQEAEDDAAHLPRCVRQSGTGCHAGSSWRPSRAAVLGRRLSHLTPGMCTGCRRMRRSSASTGVA